MLYRKPTMVNHRADVCWTQRWSDSRFVEEAVWRVGGHQLSKYRDQNENQHWQELQESCEVVLHGEKRNIFIALRVREEIWPYAVKHPLKRLT